MLTQNTVSKTYLLAVLFVLCGKVDAAAGSSSRRVAYREDLFENNPSTFSLRAATAAHEAERAAVEKFKNPSVEVGLTKADNPSKFHRCPVADFIAAGLSKDPYAPKDSRSKR